MKLVNLTKEVCLIYNTSGEVLQIEPDAKHIGIVGIGDHQILSTDDGHEVSLNLQMVSEIKGMPAPAKGVIYIVPVEIAIALQGTRDDVVFLAEDRAVNSLDGKIQRITHLRRIISRLS